MRQRLRRTLSWLDANETRVRLAFRSLVIILLLVLISRVDRAVDAAINAYNYAADASEQSRRAVDACYSIRH